MSLTCACHVARYQLERADEPAVRRWVQKNAVPASLEGPDIRALAQNFAGAKVVAVGEATHGTHEFAAFRVRLFQELVEHHGFRVFAIEAGFGEAMAIDRYVTEGIGDPKDVLLNLNYWPWYVQEVLDLIEWMREYNRDRPAADQLRFYGFDMQRSDTSLRTACAALSTAGAKEAATICAELTPVVHGQLGATISDSEFVRVYALQQRLVALLPPHEAAIRQRVGDRGFELTRHHLEIVRQSFAEARSQTFDPRDTFMAKNLVWIEQHERKPVFAWAHNAHFARSEPRDYKSETWWNPPPMGYYLTQHYSRDELIVVGTVFTTGTFNAFKMLGILGPVYGLGPVKAAKPLPHSFDGVLASSVRAPYALDLRKTDPGDPESRWFHKMQHHRVLGAGYTPAKDRDNRFGGYWNGILPAVMYDWVVVFGPTTPTRAIPNTIAPKAAGSAGAPP